MGMGMLGQWAHSHKNKYCFLGLLFINGILKIRSDDLALMDSAGMGACEAGQANTTHADAARWQRRRDPHAWAHACMCGGRCVLRYLGCPGPPLFWLKNVVTHAHAHACTERLRRLRHRLWARRWIGDVSLSTVRQA